MSLQRRRGQQAWAYRLVQADDTRGNVLRHVDMDSPTAFRAVFIPVASSRSRFDQTTSVRYTMICDVDTPGVEAFSRIRWDGREYDVMAPPLLHSGTRHTRHWTVELSLRPTIG